MQLSMAVGVVHVTRPAVDYKSYLCQEADSHSEGVCGSASLFPFVLFHTALLYTMSFLDR